jgi:hypothetical protein
VNKEKEIEHIAIFHWGEISIHTYFVVQQLIKDGIHIDFYLYTPIYAYKSDFAKKLSADLVSKVNVIELKCSRFENKVIKVNRVARLFRVQSSLICINPFLPLRTRKLFSAKKYKHIITVTQPSLFWLYKTKSSSLSKTIHYSLEVEKTTDPGIRPNSCIYGLIQKETYLLKKVRGLIIQDKQRADALLEPKLCKNDLQLIYFPVSIPGCFVEKRSDYLHNTLNIPAEKKIILYFGAIYEERKVEELTKACEQFASDKFMLVLHGAGEFSHLVTNSEKARPSNRLVDYSDIQKIISSATIGIAFYDNSWPNTRLTAFSSEKIARYLQAGVPFVALENDNYLKLKNEFNCCELINNFDELESAVNRIMERYDDYVGNCKLAYQKYYNIENAIKPLTAFLKQ